MNGFPNFFMLRGPNMASGYVYVDTGFIQCKLAEFDWNRHNSVIYYIEATIALLLGVATPLIRGTVATVEIKSDAEFDYAQKVQAACKKGVWGRGCSTYYVNGDGWNHTVYPWSKQNKPTAMKTKLTNLLRQLSIVVPQVLEPD
jgi:hypothetical protein